MQKKNLKELHIHPGIYLFIQAEIYQLPKWLKLGLEICENIEERLMGH